MSSLTVNAGDGSRAGFDTLIEKLSGKMDKLMDIQEKVLNRLDGMSHDIDDIEQDMENLKVDKEEIHVSPKIMNQAQIGREVKEICKEMSSIISVVNQRSEQQAQKLEGMEKLVLSMQQMISFIGETVKRSKVVEMMFKGPGGRKGSKAKDGKGKQATRRKSADTIAKKFDKLKDTKGRDGMDKPFLSQKGLKAQKKMKPPDVSDSISPKKQVLLLEEVRKLNQENTEKSSFKFTPQDQQYDVSFECPVDKQDAKAFVPDKHDSAEEEQVGKTDPVEEARDSQEIYTYDQKLEEEYKEEDKIEEEEEEENTCTEEKFTEVSTYREYEKEQDDVSDRYLDMDATSHTETEQDQIIDTPRKKEEEQMDDRKSESEEWAVFKAEGFEMQFSLKEKFGREATDDEDEGAERFFIDTALPPSAPFSHRIVSAKPNQIRNFYTINWQEVLGGGRFGQVHKCIENSSGLTLAAKVIKARSQKEKSAWKEIVCGSCSNAISLLLEQRQCKEVVKNEIQVMNNLDHASLIQLYAAYESRNDIILVLEYVGGGELFDRIIDENYTLMELDAVVFIRQICEGLQYMHKMSILHLDLKPENILCVNRATNKVKIIDFGLARIYKPREKLRVNFGTPEFLAPEVINFDFVSFNTDMWSLGVITYMLLSGLCPFLGDNDTETLNNILACQWNFDEEEFVDTSDEAKDFIRRLLIVNKSWRMGACESLRHPWLSNPVLHHRLHTKKTMCKSRRSSCVPPSES